MIDFPDIPRYRRNLADFYGQLGSVLRKAGRREDEEKLYREALNFWEKLATDFPTELAHRHNVASTHNQLGNLLWDVGRPDSRARAHPQR